VAPILVTGSHRSGTTWVGRMLCLSREAHGIHEPFNPAYPRSWLADPPANWFHHVEVDSASEPMFGQVEALLSLRPPLRAMAARSKSPRHLAATAREGATALAAQRAGRRPLLKDPIAFFSAEWLERQFDAEVVVLVRHPAAFASSLKRLRWTFDFTNLTRQPALLTGLLAPFAEEVERAAADPMPDVIDQSILLWRLLSATADDYRTRHPDWRVLRYEDVAGDPLPSFERLYGDLGLTWSERVVDGVHRYSGDQNSAVVPDRDKGGVRRSSVAAMWTWQSRLTGDEVARVRAGTEEEASLFYGSVDWCPPSAASRGR
jgi:hypothetical protein